MEWRTKRWGLVTEADIGFFVIFPLVVLLLIFMFGMASREAIKVREFCQAKGYVDGEIRRGVTICYSGDRFYGMD